LRVFIPDAREQLGLARADQRPHAREPGGELGARRLQLAEPAGVAGQHVVRHEALLVQQRVEGARVAQISTSRDTAMRVRFDELTSATSTTMHATASATVDTTDVTASRSVKRDVCRMRQP
jgi:hypothetical protein